MLRKMRKRSSKLSVQLGLLVMVHAALVLCWRELAADAPAARRARKAGAEVAQMHGSANYRTDGDHRQEQFSCCTSTCFVGNTCGGCQLEKIKGGTCAEAH
ncbi:hypothetical protein DIPPA_57635, partial [Diplonema papillatum]